MKIYRHGRRRVKQFDKNRWIVKNLRITSVDVTEHI